jgi:hypothetical protein
MDLDDQVLILKAFKMESMAKTFLITSGALQKRLIDKTLAKIKKENIKG